LYDLDFHAAAYHQRLEDTEGSELADPEAAHHEAMDSAIDLICDRLKGGGFRTAKRSSAAASKSLTKAACHS
jgi:hypothetical protein